MTNKFARQPPSAKAANAIPVPNLVDRHKTKLLVFQVVFIVAGFSAFFSSEIASVLKLSVLLVQAIAYVVLVVALVTEVLIIRCLYCGLRLIPYAMSHQSVGQWLFWVMEVKQCPRCRLPHEASEEH